MASCELRLVVALREARTGPVRISIVWPAGTSSSSGQYGVRFPSEGPRARPAEAGHGRPDPGLRLRRSPVLHMAV